MGDDELEPGANADPFASACNADAQAHF